MTREIQTFTGKMVDVVLPTDAMIELDDIAHALSNVCRFNGHTRKFYSVAQHSVMVSWLAGLWDPSLRKAALLHDASEAYLCDVPRPIKHLVPAFREYKGIEDSMMAAIAHKFDLPVGFHEHPIIKRADNIALRIEAKHLMGNPGWINDYAADMPEGFESYAFEAHPPEYACELFKAEFALLVAPPIAEVA